MNYQGRFIRFVVLLMLVFGVFLPLWVVAGTFAVILGYLVLRFVELRRVRRNAAWVNAVATVVRGTLNSPRERDAEGAEDGRRERGVRALVHGDRSHRP